MEIQELMDKIKLPKNAQKVVDDYWLEEKVYEEKRALFYNDIRKFFDEWKVYENSFEWFLSFSVRLALEVYDKYKEKQIPEQIYIDTFYDITIWCEDCYSNYGIYGIKAAEWIAYSLLMKLFRLGRLQFEPIELSEQIKTKKGTLTIGTPVLNIHIPAGERLDLEECKKSIAQAKEFFGDSYEAYMCDSWLLSPSLRKLLPDECNIIRFQNMFEIVREHYLFPQAEERIFKGIREDKENYPENTVLQRRAKEYLLQGNKMGIGTGIIYR